MKKIRDKDLQVYLFDGVCYYGVEEVMDIVRRHDKLVDKLKEEKWKINYLNIIKAEQKKV